MVATVESNSPRSRRPWTPDGTAHLIFQWVKLEGKTQGWVAEQLNINQATVSRVIQRYERWQAHVRDREDGRLDPQERLRAQRWLTYERNELILASCLRIANEMEGFTDVSKSTISHSASRPSQETEVRTQHSTIDRTGMVARYLRVAFRINMEQLKLAERDPPPPATPLTDDDLSDLADLDLGATAGLSGLSSSGGRQQFDEPPPIHPGSREQSCFRNESAEPCDHGLPQDKEPIDHLRNLEDDLATTPASAAPVENHADSTVPAVQSGLDLNPSRASLQILHNLHSEIGTKSDATSSQPCTCASHDSARKCCMDTCIATTSVDDPLPATVDWTKLSLVIGCGIDRG